MDNANLRDLQRLRPQWHGGHLDLFLRIAGNAGTVEVPDPYAGDAGHFEAVLDLIEAGVDGLLAVLRHRHSV
jgi:protein-tyrosine phosphatase